MNQEEILKGIMTANKQPALLSVWDAKQFCTNAIITDHVITGMKTYKVHSDSLEKFLKQDITHIYVDPIADQHRPGEATIIAGHVIVVQCIIKK